MPVKTLKNNNLQWHYLYDFGEQEVEFLKKNFKFHSLDFKDLGGETQQSKIDTYKNYLFLILQLPSASYAEQSTEFGKELSRTEDQLFIFVGKGYFITITPGKNKHLHNLYYKVVNNSHLRDKFFSNESGYLMYKVLDRFLRTTWLALHKIDKPIQAIERHIDSGERKLVFDIAKMRRLVLRLKSIAEPHQSVIHSLTTAKQVFLGKDLYQYFDDIDDYIDKTNATLQGFDERILSLQNINESLISFQTNRVMRILTIFSVAFLPLTLLTGIYGMNIALPLASVPQLIWGGFALIFVVILATILIMKKRDWI